MSDMEHAFLDAIIAEPGEDVHRLVYADWLDEQGRGERAEFIRAEVAYADMVCHHPNAESLDDPRYIDGGRSYCDDTLCLHCSLYRRAYDIEHGMDRHDTIDIDGERSRAFHGLPFSWQPDVTEWRTWRGFVHTVRCSLADWHRHGRAVCRDHPVQRVELTDREPRRRGSEWRWDLRNWDVHMTHSLAGLRSAITREFWPRVVFDELDLSPSFSAEQVARDWLSDLLIQWARPPVELPETRTPS